MESKRVESAANAAVIGRATRDRLLGGSDTELSVTAGETAIPFDIMNAIYTDTETGGLFPSIHALLSIGACCSWGGVPFHAYITAEDQMGKCVDPEAAEVNGYTPEKWEENGARPLGEVIPEYLAWVEARKKERPDAVFVCHHLAFDKPFIAEGARCCGVRDLPYRYNWRCSQVLFGQLMDRGLIERGSSSLNRLAKLSAWTGIRNAEHNALVDAEITRHGHQWLLEREAALPDRKMMETMGGRIVDLETLVLMVSDFMDGGAPWDDGIRVARLLTEEGRRIRGGNQKKEGN